MVKSELAILHAAGVTSHSVGDKLLCATFSASCCGEWFSKWCIPFYLSINLKYSLPACCCRYNSSQRVGGRPIWSQCYYALSAEEGQPDQHAHPEGPLLHQKTLCLHPQPGVYVEAGLGWVDQSQRCHLIHVLIFVKLIAEWLMPLVTAFEREGNFGRTTSA